MAHELLGLNNGRVVLSEMPNGEVTLSGSEDRFFDDNKFQNFGDLGAAIRDLIQRFAKEHKVRTDVKSIAENKNLDINKITDMIDNINFKNNPLNLKYKF